MTGTTLLLRQIHPTFVQNGYATSQAFNPSEEHGFHLSVYDADRIAPIASYAHYTTTWNKKSAGVTAMSVEECSAYALPCRPDPLDDCPEHCVVDFTSLSSGQRKSKSKGLQAKAEERGWLFQPPNAQ